MENTGKGQDSSTNSSPSPLEKSSIKPGCFVSRIFV